MTKVHYDDLTAIKTPWCLLDDDTQARLRAEPEVQMLQYGGAWVKVTSSWTGIYTYRAKSKPVRVVRWVNVYQNGNGPSYGSRASADLYLGSNRLYVFRIECDEDGGNPTISREEG